MLKEKKDKVLSVLAAAGSLITPLTDQRCVSTYSHRDAVVRDYSFSRNMEVVGGGAGGNILGHISIAGKKSNEKWREGTGLFFIVNTGKRAEKMLTAKFRVVV